MTALFFRQPASFFTRVTATVAKALAVFVAWSLITAFSVAPIVLDAEEVGPKSSAQLTVTNPNATPLAVEVTIDEVLLNETGGVRERISNSTDFLILPPQDSIGPGQARVFTLQYVGRADLTESRYYEFGVDQLPIAKPEGQAAVQIVYSIAGILSVAPLQSRADVKIVSAQVRTGEDGKHSAVLSVRNDGNAHGYITRGTLRLVYRDARGRITWRQTLGPVEMQQLVGVGVIPAKRTKEVPVSVELPNADGNLTAEFTPASVRTGRRGR